ncbi:MAG: efflux RND transporter periplasmic adaptor subunit [Proteobacteria bacterium]|nr:efflux RND transporter periplasmic adaptor subunit [Pseudomonadota bacterium]MDA1063801.1 efflux RND transporter periplasmic adaptor subunit [Pseudomonadota bacterium]
MQRKTKRILLVVGIFAGTILAAAALQSMRLEPEKKDVENLDLLVDVLELKSTTESFEILSQGIVRPRTQTVLSAEVSGSIVEISPKFIAGGVFRAGEVLMRIDPINYEAAVERSMALVRQRQIENDGAEKLRLQGYRAEAELAAAAAALASASAELVSARRNLERTYIRLPYEGMVLSKDADLGQFVNPGTPIGSTFATDSAEIRLPLTDQDLAFVEIPSSSDITGTGSANGPLVQLSAVQKGQRVLWNVQIVRSEGVVDELSRVTYVVAHLDDPYKLHGEGVPLPIGTFVSARISGSNAVDIIQVPRSAVRGSDQLLFISDEDTIEIRSVSILRSDALYVYVDGGAEPGERIATTAIAAPTNGMSVRTANTAVAAEN